MVRVPQGAVLETVYFTVPGWHGQGPAFSDSRDAYRYGFALHRQQQSATSIELQMPHVDQRWVMRHPDGSATDMCVERIQLPTERPKALPPYYEADVEFETLASFLGLGSPNSRTAG